MDQLELEREMFFLKDSEGSLSNHLNLAVTDDL